MRWLHVHAAGRRVALASLLLAVPAAGQRLSVEVFAVDEGLPSASIHGLEQDPTGRIWILNRAGLTVYDGRTFYTHGQAEGLPEEALGGLAIDSTGRPWVAMLWSLRVFFLDGSTWRALPRPVANPNFKYVTDLAAASMDGRERIVMGLHGGGLRVWDGAAWTAFGPDEGLPSDIVNGLTAHGGAIYVATQNGPCRIAQAALDCRLRELDPRLRQPILALLPDERTAAAPRLWILGDGWLGYVEAGRLHEVAHDLESLSFTPGPRGALAIDRTGGVYFGSPARAYYLDGFEDHVHPLGIEEGLIAEGMVAVLIDRESSVWLGSARGLSRIANRRFLTFDENRGLLEGETSALLEPAPGRFILGHNTGLTFLDDQGAETLRFELPAGDGATNTRVLDMAMEEDGTVWLAAFELGLVRLATDRSWSALRFSDPVFAVEIDAEERLWVSDSYRLFVREGGDFRQVDLGFATSEAGLLRWLAPAPDAGVYAATSGGLLWRDGDTWRVARNTTGGTSNAYNLLAEPSGTVWVGTLAGLFELRDGDLVKVERGALRVDRPVYFILRDGDGQLWFGTDDGVRVWNGTELRHLTARHGLAGRETNRGASLVDHRGRVWIGTDQGISIYQKAHDRVLVAPPGVELSAFQAGGEDQALAGDVDLSHVRSTLTFHADLIAFSREEEIQWRYRLEGFGEDWQGPEPFSPGGVRYTNVPPGAYRFRIAVRWAGGGSWSEEAVSPAIVIRRPWWAQIWFYVGAVCAAAFLFIGVPTVYLWTIRSRARQLEVVNRRLSEQMEKRKRADEERERLIRELEAKNTELEGFAYTLSHDLKTPLVTVKGFLGLLEKDMAKHDTEQIRQDFDHIRRASDSMGALLDDLRVFLSTGQKAVFRTTVALAELVGEAVDAAATPIARRGVRVDIAPELPVVQGDEMLLAQLARNLIDNALAYLGDQREPRIEIGVRGGKDGERVVYVRDNGMGIEFRYHEKIFDLFERLDPRAEGTGLGLALVRRIVELHGGRVWVESEGLGRGSTFCFTLPQHDTAAGMEI